MARAGVGLLGWRLAGAGAGAAPKSTFGGSLMAASLSTAKLALVLAPMTIAVRLLGKVRTDTL
jgi:hypothetical protein